MKFAVVGCGSMGRRRIRYAQQLKIGEVIGYDIRPDRMAEVRELLGLRTVAGVDELIAEKPSAISICVPPAEHMFYLKLAVEQGWHFMSENPVFYRLDGLDDILAGVKRKGLITHVGCNLRFHQAIRKIKELVQNGAIGPCSTGIVEVGEWLPDWHPYEPYTDYYPSHQAMGGGLDAICDLEWMIDIFGRPSRVLCMASTRSSLDIDTEDIVHMLLDFPKGPQLALHCDMIQRSHTHRVKFIGEKGTIEWEAGQRKVCLYSADTKQVETFDETIDVSGMPTMQMKPGWEWVEPMYFEDSRVFIDRVRAGDASTESLETGIENVKLVLTALNRNL